MTRAKGVNLDCWATSPWHSHVLIAWLTLQQQRWLKPVVSRLPLKSPSVLLLFLLQNLCSLSISYFYVPTPVSCIASVLMKRFRSIKDCSESIGIKSPKAVKRLGKDIRAFYRSQSPKDGSRQTLHPLAQAFIDRKGGTHFSALRDISQEEILESVVRLLQIQHRNDMDNSRRLKKRTARSRGRQIPSDHLMEEDDGSFTGGMLSLS